MSSYILIVGFLLFVSIFAIHLFIWHFFNIKRELFTLLCLFIMIPFCTLYWMMSCQLYPAVDIVAVFLVYFSVSLVYLQTYPALKERIPSFKILLLIHQHQDTGLEEPEITRSFHGDEGLFLKKVKELENDSLVRVGEDKKLYLSFAGCFLANLFMGYRRLLKLEWGRG